jgi:hypothetical protein
MPHVEEPPAERPDRSTEVCVTRCKSASPKQGIRLEGLAGAAAPDMAGAAHSRVPREGDPTEVVMATAEPKPDFGRAMELIGHYSNR